MSLTGLNRILVREGLKRIHHTTNIGMRALISQCGLLPEQIDTYHFGFVLGPCINAAGRLDTANLILYSILCIYYCSRLCKNAITAYARPFSPHKVTMVLSCIRLTRGIIISFTTASFLYSTRISSNAKSSGR